VGCCGLGFGRLSIPLVSALGIEKGGNGMIQQPQGPVCQSCAMPMNSPKMLGTNADGSKSEEFCTYCFQNGMFSAPNITVQEMIDKCVSIMTQQKVMLEEQARALMTKTIPHLKRWKTP
jgi:hypothetical protein